MCWDDISLFECTTTGFVLQRTKKIMGERVVKYFEDRVKSRVGFSVDILLKCACTCVCVCVMVCA